MSDVGGVAYDYATPAAGAAGIGAAAGVAAMQRARSRRETNGGPAGDYSGYEERTPYPAFAGPGPQPYDHMSVPGLRYRQSPGGPEADLIDAAGLGVSVAAAPAAAPFINRHPSDRTQHTDLSRNKSQGSLLGSVSEAPPYSSVSPPPGESYASHYQPGYQPDPATPPQQSQQLHASHASEALSAGDPFQTQPSPALANPHDPYDAYTDDVVGDDGADVAGHGGAGQSATGEEGRMSFEDEEDYGMQPRVLKVRVCVSSLDACVY